MTQAHAGLDPDDNRSIKGQIRTQYHRDDFMTKVCQKEAHLNVILINFTWKYIWFSGY